MKVTFFYKRSDLSSTGQVVGDDTYVATSSNTITPQYGKVGGVFTELTSTSTATATYVFPYSYTSSTATNAQMYGTVDGGHGKEYVELERNEIYGWSKSGYVYTPTAITNTNSISSSSPTRTQYVLYNGGFSTIHSIRNSIYFNSSDKIWYRTRSGSYGRYTYSNPITEAYTRSSVATESYTGDRYAISGYTISRTTSKDGTQYGKIGDSYYALSKTLQGYEYSYDDSAYTGTRYTRRSDNTVYTGTVYMKDNTGSFVLENDVYYSGAIYGQRSGSDVYEELTKSVETTYAWSAGGDPYTGTRYLKYSANSGNSTYPYKVEWEGLYGQNFLKYNYSFPEQFKWNEDSSGSSTGQTLLDGFTVMNSGVPSQDYKLYSQGAAPDGLLYHVRQKLDGTYSITETNYYDIAHVNKSSSLGFYFTNKFDGFDVCGYSTVFYPSGSGATFHEAYHGQERVNLNTSSNTYYVYHQRKEVNLDFNENYGAYTVYSLDHIKYEQPLKAYADAYVPAERDHYTFTGWYEDITCTQLFDFEHELMPNANKVLYAGWTPERYLVTVNADGGEMSLGGTFSSYFKINYNELIDEYAAIQRNYVKNTRGEYVYFNFTYEKLCDLAETEPALRDEDGNLNFPGALRKAFYIKASEVRDFYENGANVTVGETTYSYRDYITNRSDFDTFTDWIRYSPVPEGIAEYSLYAWFKVLDDGTVETTPYNFMNHVEENVNLIAKWVNVGKYSITYDPTMRSTGITGEMARYNDPLDSEKKYADGASVVVLQAPTNLRLDQMINPDDPSSSSPGAIDPSEYIFRGWRIVDVSGNPLEENVFYDPGDTLYIDDELAESSNVIHMEAYYEKKESTVRRVDYTTLTLHANLAGRTDGKVNREGLANDKHEYAVLSSNTLVLDRQLNNFEVHLGDYRKNFTNTNGYVLIGWDTDPDHSPDDYIPDYYADAVIGVDKETPLPNDLYAVWEPMVYLTLDNRTSQSLTFDLTFDYTGTIYDGPSNTVAAEYLRRRFSDENDPDYVYVVKTSNGQFTVTIASGKEITLVIPEGIGHTYTVSGSYATQNGGLNASDLIVYNSGDANSISLKYNSSTGKWDKNYGASASVHNIGDSIAYTTDGLLIEGAQGQLVMFSETDPTTVLHIKTGYYDTSTEAWVESDSLTGPMATPAFSPLPTGTVQTDDDYSVRLINNNLSVKFGLSVSHSSAAYKFIGWYTTLGAKPNTATVDGYVSGFGNENIDGVNAPLLAVPLKETTYYALYVPYASGSLTVTHSQKADSAGECDETDGLTVAVSYEGAAPIVSTGNASAHAAVTIIVSEQSLSDTVAITVGAKPEELGVYASTYKNDDVIPTAQITDNTATTGYYEYSESVTVEDLLTSSDTVKGLMTLKSIDFYSSFSLGYEITYRYTARDGKPKDYVIRGTMDSYDETEFKQFVIEHTPYTRTLTGDTVWNTDGMKVTKKPSGVEAKLEETPNIRGFCRVTVVNADTSINYETVQYGCTFTEEQAADRIADESIVEGGVTKYFDHWDIINTRTGARISECYNREFHFAVWNDYTIRPVYAEVPSVDPTPEWQFVTIDYIDTSRNQWNKNNGVVSDTVTDKVVVDLDISFNDGTNLILDSFNDHGEYAYRLGVIFELVGTTDDDRTDNDVLLAEDGDSVLSRVRDVLARPKDSGTATDAYYGDARSYYYTRISISESTVSNFNRSEFARSFTTGNVNDKVFRVYAYMILPDPNGNSVVDDDEIIVSDPYYMTVYGVANRTFVMDRD